MEGNVTIPERFVNSTRVAIDFFNRFANKIAGPVEHEGHEEV